MSLYPIKRFIKLFTVIDIGTQNNLAVNLNASVHEFLKHFNAPSSTSTNQIAAHVRRNCMQRDVHGFKFVRNDALNILIGEVGKRNKIALQEAQAIIVISNGKRRAHVFWQHSHKAELARVYAGLDTVKEHVNKVNAPIFSRLTLKHTFIKRLITRNRNFKLTEGAVSFPTPINQIFWHHAIDLLDNHARLKASLPRRTTLFNGLNQCTKSTRFCISVVCALFHIRRLRFVQ